MVGLAPVSQLGEAPKTLCSTCGEPMGEFGMDVGQELVLYWLVKGESKKVVEEGVSYVIRIHTLETPLAVYHVCLMTVVIYCGAFPEEGEAWRHKRIERIEVVPDLSVTNCWKWRVVETKQDYLGGKW